MAEDTAAERGAQDRALADLHEDIWQRLARGVRDRRAASRHPVLATVGRAGGAEARVLVLRGASRANATLKLHTDSASGKVAELRAEPRACLLVWDAAARLQIRLRGRVEVRPGDAAEWRRVPEGARAAYGGTPPGAPLAAPEEVDATPDPARFTVLTARLEEIEALHLGQPHHRRARFRADEGWAGRWIAP